MDARRAIARGLCAGLLSAALTATAQPRSADEEDLAQAFGDRTAVTIATGTRQPLARAPAAATVVTADEIRALGLTDLDQVLALVPGLHVSRSVQLWAPIYGIRGIQGAQLNPHVLVLQNGVPTTALFIGDRGAAWGGLSVENIARVEVIRGPGSALYGADALAGVVNIVTKDAAAIGGTQVGLRAGSFGTRSAWLLHGGRWHGLEVAAWLHAGSTDGHRGQVDVDAQTALDASFGTHASQAPGPVSTGHDALDAQLDLGQGPWHLRLGHKRRGHVGAGAGVAQALDPHGVGNGRRTMADLSYDDPRFAPDWALNVQGNWLHLYEGFRVTLFPPGTFGGAFPDGMQGEPERWERHARLALSAFYTGFRAHRVRIGTGVEHAELYKVRELKNFRLTYVPGTGNVPSPLGELVEADASERYTDPHVRRLSYAFMQDEWLLSPDWTLTAGVRHDRYSDFGGTTNPRFALVWNADYDLTLKLLHGRAFRAPAFTEAYSLNNPVLRGNPALRPETLQMSEAVLAWQPRDRARLAATVFGYRMRDLVRGVPNAEPATGASWQNFGRQRGRGLELEAALDVGLAWRLAANLALQRSIDETCACAAGLAPRQRWQVRADWRGGSGWAASAQFHAVAGRERQAGDARPPPRNYHLLDLVLRKVLDGGSWELDLALRNALDADAREPSPAPGQIPNDLPLPRRNWALQARHAF